MKVKGRGHWPKGVRRNTDTMKKLPIKRIISKTKSVTKGAISNRGLARQIGVDEKAVRNWKKGIDIPRIDRAVRLNTVVKRLGRYGQSKPTRFGEIRTTKTYG
jgi:hypothetical protein